MNIVIGLLTALFVFVSILLIPLILLQKGKGSMGLGSMGGGAQMLFGGSGGQDLFQKLTWTLGAIFMFGSLAISIMKTQDYRSSRYLKGYKTQQQLPE
ncbi:MAG: preprotein translocase subunit SecG [Candidatus Babeliales bacterium]